MSSNKSKPKLTQVREIDILGKPYSITGIRSPKLDLDQHRAMGITNNKQQVFQLDLTQAHEQLMDTLLHEILHAVDMSLAIGLKEKQVHRIAGGLWAVFQANPDLLQLFAGKIQLEIPVK